MQSAATQTPTRTLRRSEREREFLSELGQRIHVIRRARRLSRPRVTRLTGISSDQLADIEQGIAMPNALSLYRLAEALRVPPPMLLDEKATPLKVLRLLAGLHD